LIAAFSCPLIDKNRWLFCQTIKTKIAAPQMPQQVPSEGGIA
jgi:hypothetical protein